MISVLILTLNEEANLMRCLDSVRWSDDVLVLDSFSTDKTVEVAMAAGVRVMQNRFVSFADQRNCGVEHGGLKHDWVLHLDADEMVTDEFKKELLEKTTTDQICAYRVPSKMMFQGRWLKYSGMYPAYQVRFGKRDVLKFKQVGHGQREDIPSDRLGTMNNALLHYSFSKGMEDWIAKHNRYSSAEAVHELESGGQQLDFRGLLAFDDTTRRRRAAKGIAARLPCRPAFRFLYMYLFRLGFLDGLPGYHYSRMIAMYEYMIVLKTRELRLRGVQPSKP